MLNSFFLFVFRSANKQEIIKAYRKLAQQWHPDNFQSESEKKEAEKKFIDIASAKEVLTDPGRWNWPKAKTCIVCIRHIWGLLIFFYFLCRNASEIRLGRGSSRPGESAGWRRGRRQRMALWLQPVWGWKLPLQVPLQLIKVTDADNRQWFRWTRTPVMKHN